MKNKNQHGFSILELMIVLAIVGIFAAIGIPSMRDQLLNTQVKTAATDAHLSLLLARSEAIKRAANVDVLAADGTTPYDWAGGWSVLTTGTVTTLRTQEALTGLTVDCNPTACPDRLTYSRTGRATPATEFRIYINGNDKVRMRCVSVSLSGKPRIEVDNNTNTGDGCS